MAGFSISVLSAIEARFVQMAADFVAFNPHLSLSVYWNGERLADLSALQPGWRKWRACDPTSAHWYDRERFGRYMAAHIARDEDQGRPDRTVRDFISELRGLTRSDKQKAVLAACGASGVTLADYFRGGDEAIGNLLTWCKEYTKPVDPKDLGLIGQDHVRQICLTAGGHPETLRYKRLVGTRSDGLPCLIETAFAWCPDVPERQLITGVNFSVGIGDPFRRLGIVDSLSSLLSRRYCGPSEPIVVIVHYTCPWVDYTDRGKSTLALPWGVGSAIAELVEAVTKPWYEQRKREEKEAARAYERRDRLTAEKKVSIKDAAWEVMEEAYLKASDDGQLPAKARQIMYAARGAILKKTGKDTLDDAYFTQTLLPDFINEHPELCADWDVVWDARGTFIEPHTGVEIPLGTVEVRQYLGERPAFGSTVHGEYDDRFPTAGPENRYDTALFIEKEGFEPLLNAVDMASRFDIGIMSTKGMSVTAARLLVDRLTARGVQQFLVLHDFDVSGFSIFGTLGTSNRRYSFDNSVPLIDIGLRLADVQAMELEAEPVAVSGDWQKRASTLQRHGASDDEINFLCDRRVELNAMTSRQFVDFVEAKLVEHGVAKVIPDDAVLERQARRVIEHQLTEQAVEAVSQQIADQVKAAQLPPNLRKRIADEIAQHPVLSCPT